MGWVGGLIMMIAFALITLYTSHLLADCTKIDGKRIPTYMDCVRTTMGPVHAGIIAWVQYFNLFLTAIAYTITPATSMQSIAHTYCDAEDPDCFDKYWKFAIIFGATQIPMSQMPNLESLWWVSAIGAFMSFAYSVIALALSINMGNHHGTVRGFDASTVQRMWNVWNAMGAIVFAFSFSFILVEITETMKETPKRPARFHIKRAVNISMATILCFYLAVSIAGYMAFGNEIEDCGNILTCFTRPKWVIRMTNIFVIIHMLPAYQVFSQPIFEFTERVVGRRVVKDSRFGKLMFRLSFRSLYVVIVTVIGVCLPFFSDVVGLIGAIGFWPATVFYPIEMWITVYKPNLTRRILMETLNVICFFITVMAIAGSVQLIVVDSKDYTVFGD